MDPRDAAMLENLDMDGMVNVADLGLLAPSREGSTVNPAAAGGQMMPYGADAMMPTGAFRQASFGTQLSQFLAGGGLPLDQGMAPPAASGVPMDSQPSAFENLKLVIQSHSVHKVENADTEDREYVVSNLRTFNIEVVLVDEANTLATGVNVGLEVQLLFENGLVVQKPNEQEQLLTGETEVVIIGGRGVFKLKMGPSILSSKMGKQKFRIKIEPKNERIRRDYRQLTVLTEGLKVVTKLERKPPPPRGGGAAAAAAAEPSSHAIPMPGAVPGIGAPPPLQPSYPAGMGAPAGLPPLGPPVPVASALGMPAGRGGPDPLGLVGAGGAGGAGGAAAAAAAGGPSEATALVPQLQAELSQERSQRAAMADKLREQREQIVRLSEDNKKILEELSRIKSAIPGAGHQPGGDAARQRY